MQGNTGSWFGTSVSSAGDVNGDGYCDVVIGAPSYDNGEADEGRAYVYHGSAQGLSTSADWTLDGSQTGAMFGFSVSSAGDVNADGYSDVVIGSPYYDNGEADEGRAYVYHGSAQGLSITPDWTAEGGLENASFGCVVASIGDVNGDGYGDVIIGANSYSNGETEEGATFAYYGNNGGLALHLKQEQAESEANIHSGGFSLSESEFAVSLLKHTPFGRGKVKLQVEVKAASEPFDGTDLKTSAEWEDTGDPAGEPTTASMILADVTPGDIYHWRSRLLYQRGGFSPWMAQQSKGFGNAHHVRLPECGNNRMEAMEECDSDSGCCVSATCLFAEADTHCGEGPTSCSNQDTCDGVGVCLENNFPSGASCGTHATCDEADEGFTCTCDPGWQGHDGNCNDVDECSAGSDTCDDNATCSNIPGSFTCTCNEGYEGNDVTDDDDNTTDDSGSNNGCRSVNAGTTFVSLLMLLTGVALRRKGWNVG